MSQQDISLDPTKTTLAKSRLLPWMLMAMRSTTLLVKFVFTLFIAKYLSLDALGIYGLVSAAGIVSPAILGLGIMHLLSRAAVRQPISETKADLKHYFKYLTSLFFILGGLTLGYFVIRGEWMLALLILLVILFEHLNSELYQLMINLSRPVLADILHFTRSASWVLVYMALAIFYIAFRNIYALLIAWLIGTALCALVYLWVLSRLPRSSTTDNLSLWNWLRKSCKQSSWLYVNGVATTGANYSDRYLIGAFLNLELTGLYVFFWQIQSALSNLIYTGFIQIARPEFVRNFAKIKPEWRMVNNLIRNTAVMAVIFSVLASIGMAVVINYLNMPLVDQYYNLLILILIAFIFNVIAEAQVLVFYSKYKDHLVSLITLVVFAVNLLGCICSIPFWGLWGAGVTAIFSALTRVLLLAWFINGFKRETVSTT